MILSSMPFRTIAIAGASGFIGRKVLNHLLTIPKVSTITVIRQSKAPHDFPKSPLISIAPISSYEDTASLAAALQGHDILISTISGAAAGIVDPLLLSAAIAAGVRRFIPSEYTVDVMHPNAIEVAGSNVLAARIANARDIQVLAEQGEIEFTTLVTGAFLDWWFEMPNSVVNRKDRKVMVLDGGNKKLTGATTEFVAKCIEPIIIMPEQLTRNRRMRIAEVGYSSNDMLSAFGEVTGEKWTAIHQSTDELVGQAVETAERGDARGQYLGYILKLNFDGKGAASFEEGSEFAPLVKRQSLVEIVRESFAVLA